MTPVTEIQKVARNLKIEIIMATCYLSLTLDFVCNCYIDVNSGQPKTRVIICTQG